MTVTVAEWMPVQCLYRGSARVDRGGLGLGRRPLPEVDPAVGETDGEPSALVPPHSRTRRVARAGERGSQAVLVVGLVPQPYLFAEGDGDGPGVGSEGDHHALLVLFGEDEPPCDPVLGGIHQDHLAVVRAHGQGRDVGAPGQADH
jgi:hypothetical protein